ncbi:MAG: (2Fe-2S) ferredoxin domain-containing protein [Eubacteriales bacterium]|jgi:NADH:ubiquinone oxidoreductase subunit E|nr:(2Fe-2S) ferredoxin domain-containing protein [Eubacteriales bacterium]MDD4105772.1 (2Fe-2S) ferredoxin domain-containing protein [Eubacteriales bacterium]MDD4710758.1 (2Fe-2S) ferredoxin domain-containing protein [Eubacteriales bacterium]NLO14575.1 (2Fe-2S) ferredoxin domain-containing protein [Clostridiales bacterium]
MGKIVVEVCAGTHCTLMGSMDIIDAIASLPEIGHIEDGLNDIEVIPVPCRNHCKENMVGPIVYVEGEIIPQADQETVLAAIINKIRAQKV